MYYFSYPGVGMGTAAHSFGTGFMLDGLTDTTLPNFAPYSQWFSVLSRDTYSQDELDCDHSSNCTTGALSHTTIRLNVYCGDIDYFQTQHFLYEHVYEVHHTSHILYPKSPPQRYSTKTPGTGYRA